MVAFKNLALALFSITASAAPLADANADAPDFHLGGDNLVRRQDYNQNYKTSGNVNFSPSSSGYSVSFSNAGDFVVGKGWTTGSERFVAFSLSRLPSALCPPPTPPSPLFTQLLMP